MNRTVTWVLAVIIAGMPAGQLSNAGNIVVPVTTAGDYFVVNAHTSAPAELYIKGVNLSAALPGSRPFEQADSPELYERWLRLIAEMNANTVRVLDTMPPAFYTELAKHNRQVPESPLWLMQGIWIEAPLSGAVHEPAFRTEWQAAVEKAVSAAHGLSGPGAADVSPWLLGYIAGQEWSPGTVNKVNDSYPARTTYDAGKYIVASSCSPMESWLAEVCDQVLQTEARLAGQLHPVTFVNWAPLDPIDHRQGFLDYLGDIPEAVLSENHDFVENDSASISVRSLQPTPENPAGVFASYHVYPYYPDFISRQPQYARVHDAAGPNSFLGYLKDLKSRYADMPLLVSEYGLASSMLAVHRHPEGWHHGGLTEQEVAHELPRLAQSVRTAGCAGGMVFAWNDEWFKQVWLWNSFYQPPEETRFWKNIVDPEQNFGLLAIDPGVERTICSMSGKRHEWSSAEVIQDLRGTQARFERVLAMHDESALYLGLELAPRADADLDRLRLLVGLDVNGPETGNTAFLNHAELQAAGGMELLIELADGGARLYQAANYRFWNQLNRWHDETVNAGASPPLIADSLGWVLPQFESNMPTLSRTGQLEPAQSWPLNPLPGTAGDSTGMVDTQALWHISTDRLFVELRLPWMLAGFCAPHKRLVLQFDEYGRVTAVSSAGIAVYVALEAGDGTILATAPQLDLDGVFEDPPHYTWAGWGKENIMFHERLKPAYLSLQREFSSY